MTLLKQPELKAEVRGNGLEVDTVLGVVRYAGVAISLQLFEHLGQSANVGRAFRLVKRDGDVVTVEDISI